MMQDIAARVSDLTERSKSAQNVLRFNERTSHARQVPFELLSGSGFVVTVLGPQRLEYQLTNAITHDQKLVCQRIQFILHEN